MDAEQFLRAVWPDTGVYALATLFTVPGTATKTFAHKTFTTIKDAADYVALKAPSIDLYFAVHSLREARVWNPAKTNRKTGELGAFEVRSQSNMLAARAFFLDLDVGDAAGKYPTRDAALKSLISFTKSLGLPRPLVVASGNGLHVYWPIETALPSPEWRQHAAKLRQLAKHHGLLFDPSRTTDTASVLRVAETWNFKEPANPKKVSVLVEGSATPTPMLIKLLDTAVIRGDVTVRPLPNFTPTTELGSNIVDDPGPPIGIKAVLAACAQMRRIATLKGNVSEPEWYHAINIVRFVTNGHKITHRFSEGHPNYNPAETDKKVAQLEAKGIKPTSCAKLAEVAGDELCIGCAFAGKVRSPIVAARFKDTAPPPTIQLLVGSTIETFEVPPPPRPYARLANGAITKTAKSKDGDEIVSVIYEHDLYPIQRMINAGQETEQQQWRVTLPRAGAKDFTLDADALYDRRKFITAIANNGIYPSSGSLQDLQDYMTAYIAELQKQSDAAAQVNHLGWSDDLSSFVLPDKTLTADGGVHPSVLGLGARRASTHVHKRGTIERQVELLDFYRHAAYLPNQFFILSSLAAPIFFATGHHGVVVNASGEAGASKSSSLYTAASLWGQPEMYPINGTNNGATVRGRNERVTIMSNLPVCVDEITHLPVKDAIDLAMGITQPGHRIRLDQTGVERGQPQSYKATIMLATANNSLHGLLSIDNAAGTAGSMRVFEIRFNRTTIHSKPQADDFLHDLKLNYGHVGEAFMAFVVRYKEQVVNRVRKVMREIDEAANIQSSERFWSATVATVLVAGEIASKLGLVHYDVAAIRRWALERQIPSMRGLVVTEYASPIGVLADFLETINDHILVVRHHGGNLANVLRAPRGQMLAHYDVDEKVMWVLKKGFKDYCVRHGANAYKILEDLWEPTIGLDNRALRVVVNKQVRKILGANTEYGKAQSWCFQINMAHPEVTGAVDIEVAAASPNPSTTPARGGLRLV